MREQEGVELDQDFHRVCERCARSTEHLQLVTLRVCLDDLHSCTLDHAQCTAAREHTLRVSS
eukprot:1310844-Prymnesium_polylepis.2